MLCSVYVLMFMRVDSVHGCLCTVYVFTFITADAVHGGLCYVLCMCSCS